VLDLHADDAEVGQPRLRESGVGVSEQQEKDIARLRERIAELDAEVHVREG
jgi:hypothetical protein